MVQNLLKVTEVFLSISGEELSHVLDLINNDQSGDTLQVEFRVLQLSSVQEERLFYCVREPSKGVPGTRFLGSYSMLILNIRIDNPNIQG